MPVEYSLLERNRIANNLFGGANFEIRAYSNTISATGTGGTELSGDGYSPIAITNNLTNFPTATNGVRANAVAFEKTFTAQKTIASIGIFSATGDFLARKVLMTSLVVGANQNWKFPVGSITFEPQNLT